MTTRYFAAGAGAPLVLLHGDGESAFDWAWTLPALARTRRVYAPDLPGSGENAKPAADYSPALLESFAASFLDAVEIERAAVAGNSLGGSSPCGWHSRNPRAWDRSSSSPAPAWGGP